MRQSIILKSLAFLAVVLAIIATAPAFADAVLVNIDLSGATVGDAIPIGPVGTHPVTAYTGFGGYDSPMGTGLVSNVAGIGKAADLTTYHTNDQVGALYLDTSLSIAAQKLFLSFDVNVLSQAATGYGQNPGGAPVLFGVRLYSNSSAQWATTFNLSPTSTTGGLLAFRNFDNTALQAFGTYTVGTATHVEIDLDYGTGTANAYVNGSLAYTGYPLRTGIAPAATTSELFMYLNGSAGTANEVAIGNVSILTIPVPASVWTGLAMLAGLGTVRVLRNRLRTAA